MRLLQRSAEAPSLETWLSRDVPHEAELKQELLAKLGRERAVDALLQIYEREEAKREKRRIIAIRITIVLGVAYLLFGVTGPLWLNLIPLIYWRIVQVTLLGFVGILNLINLLLPNHKISLRHNNTVTALFNYADNLRVADALCRALSGYRHADKDNRWLLQRYVTQILPQLPDKKDSLSKEARENLKNCLEPMETGGTADITPELEADRTFYAGFQTAILRYFARTTDKDALRSIRKLAQAKTYSSDGVRVRDAAQSALHSLLRSEP